MGNVFVAYEISFIDGPKVHYPDFGKDFFHNKHLRQRLHFNFIIQGLISFMQLYPYILHTGKSITLKKNHLQFIKRILTRATLTHLIPTKILYSTQVLNTIVF